MQRSFETNAFFNQIVEMPDGGFLLGGWSSSEGDGSQSSLSFGLNDVRLHRLDSSGQTLWEMPLGGSGEDFPRTTAMTDGGFILGMVSSSGINGNKTAPGFGDYDLWVVKLGPEPPPDDDGDGVPDRSDLCPKTLPGAVVDAQGCSIDQLCPCEGPWRNRGEYMRCLGRVVARFAKAGLLK